MQDLPRMVVVLSVFFFCAAPALSDTYEVGPGQPIASIGEVPWESLVAGDEVVIHWRTDPYKEKFVIGVRGTQQNPIVIRGVPGNNGELPVIDGRDATTRSQLDFWNERRGVIKFGGSSVPSQDPAWIVLENLDIRSGRTPYQFTGGDGVDTYADNCAAVFIETGENITIRNCVMRDSGNGFFVSHAGRDITVEGCWIYDNGIEGSIYEHNNYTEAFGITFQYNYFGPLRANCGGANLKDRSAGTVIRYNWIESGNRQLDLVDSDYPEFYNDPLYRSTYVYGNILIEPDGAGNSQITHYGGDSGDTARYRKGTLYFYNNTVISTRSDNTTLFRLSSNEESCDCRNNIVYVTESGDRLAMLDETGVLHLLHNWFKPGRVDSHGSLAGTITDDGGNLTGADPGFLDEGAQDFHLAPDSDPVNAGADLPAAVLPDHDVVLQYVKHRTTETRPRDAVLDMGAYEVGEPDTTPPKAPENLIVSPP